MPTPVLILMGSESDFPILAAAVEIFDQFQVGVAVHVASAHRSPELVAGHLREADGAGTKVIICGAGMAAHLAGVVASRTILPVIGVPLDTPPLNGVDSLYSTVMMPPGIPVATVGIGKAGAKNAAYLALNILALTDAAISERVQKFRREMPNQVQAMDQRVQAKLAERKGSP